MGKLDVDRNSATVQQYGFMRIPTLILFQNGKAVKRIIGYQPQNALVAQLAGLMGATGVAQLDSE